MEIPQVLKDFIAALSDDNAEQVWLYLDGTRYAISETIDYICETHKELVKRVSGEEYLPKPEGYYKAP